jgi:amino acid transporter
MAGTVTPKKVYTSDEPSSSRTSLLAHVDEESTLLELASTAEISTHSGLIKQLTFFDGYTLLASFMIGSGVFSSPCQINNNVPSPGAAILVWICGGLLTWAGAACFAELGAAIPVNGGMQEYLQYIYGDFAAMVVSFTWIAAVKPCSMAVLSIIFAEYWTRAILGASRDGYYWVDKSLAIGALFVMTASNSFSTRTSSRLNGVFYFIKLSTVGFIAVLTLLVMFVGLNGQGEEPSKDWKTRNWFANRPTQSDGKTIDWDKLSPWESMGYYSAAIWAGLWAYGGWDNVSHGSTFPIEG